QPGFWRAPSTRCTPLQLHDLRRTQIAPMCRSTETLMPWGGAFKVGGAGVALPADRLMQLTDQPAAHVGHEARHRLQGGAGPRTVLGEGRERHQKRALQHVLGVGVIDGILENAAVYLDLEIEASALIRDATATHSTCPLSPATAYDAYRVTRRNTSS